MHYFDNCLRAPDFCTPSSSHRQKTGAVHIEASRSLGGSAQVWWHLSPFIMRDMRFPGLPFTNYTWVPRRFGTASYRPHPGCSPVYLGASYCNSLKLAVLIISPDAGAATCPSLAPCAAHEDSDPYLKKKPTSAVHAYHNRNVVHCLHAR